MIMTRSEEEAIIIPIKDKTSDPSPAAIGYRTENGVTVVSIEKSKMLYVRFVPPL